MPQPKVLLFDIGGVCVVSPFQAILDYERTHGIPEGYINFAISRSSPTGAWQRLERGEIPLDDTWFPQFKSDLEKSSSWQAWWHKKQNTTSSQPALSSLSAPAADTAAVPASIPPIPNIDAKALFWEMMRSSRAPDPYMYPALKKLRGSGKYVLGALSNTVIFPPGILDDRQAVFENGLKFEKGTYKVNGEEETLQIREAFDVFVSSAHVGLRKPDPQIYKLAVQQLNNFVSSSSSSSTSSSSHGNITPADVLFIDDIGQNLKAAREAGMQTLKVNLGKNILAVQELERITGLDLLGQQTFSSSGGGNARSKL